MDNGPVNSLSPSLVASLGERLDHLAQRDDWKILVLAGNESVFCAGGDLQAMKEWMSDPDPGRPIAAYAQTVQDLAGRLESLSQVTVAECLGSALGGGLELALACDLRLASSKARLGLPEVGLGLLPGAGGTQRLTRLCGRAMALRMMLTAEIVSAERALDVGIVQWVFGRDEFEDRAEELYERLDSMPVDALRHVKACVSKASEHPGNTGFLLELSALADLVRSEATQRRVMGFLAGGRGSAVAARR